MLKLTVIGDPIEHSKSPIIQQELATKAGIEIEYTRTKVNADNIAEFIQFARTNLNGFNVTMPCKMLIIPYLDSINEQAKKIGAVNTVKNANGKLEGFNTDSTGFIATLPAPVSTYKNVVIYGKGGAAKAIGINFEQPVYLHREQLHNYNFSETDLFVNCAPLGMKDKSQDFETLEFLQQLPADAIVYDIVYNPDHQTRLIKTAKTLQLQTFEGMDLLQAQAIKAFQIFTA
jgi:shikimate dehydrogenase